MRNKVRLVVVSVVAVVVLLTLSGCRLAREDMQTNSREDRLIGVFVTTQYLDLFDFESYFHDNAGSFTGGEMVIGSDVNRYQGRLYAVLETKTLTNEETGATITNEEYVFPDVDGIAFYSVRMPDTPERDGYVTSGSGEGISDVHMGLHYGDEQNSTTLEGTVYMSSDKNNTYYFNPIYQSADGRVYAASGSGFFSGGDQTEGAAYSQKLDASYTVTENGKTVTDKISIKISVKVMYPPEKITILQMDHNSTVVSRAEYAPGEVLERIGPQADTAYFIVETDKTDSEGQSLTTRALYGADAEYLESFSCRADGVCLKRQSRILWDNDWLK